MNFHVLTCIGRLRYGDGERQRGSLIRRNYSSRYYFPKALANNDRKLSLFADRKRRQNAELAEEIFGRGRKGTPTGPASRKHGPGPSLASRVGISKVIRDIGDTTVTY